MIIDIYTLSNPINGEVRYIGQTSKSLNKRLGQHLYEARKGIISNHRTNWIRSLLNKGIKPAITKIDTCFSTERVEKEQYWILHYKLLNCKLVNETIGGEGLLGHKKKQVTVSKLKESLRTHSRCKAVYQFDSLGNLIDKFRNFGEAQERTGFTLTKIRKCCEGEKLSYKGFQWKYSSKCGVLVQQRRNTRVSERNSFVAKRRKIKVTLGNGTCNSYESLKAASIATGIASPNIIKRIKGIYNNNPIKFEYEETS